MADLVTILRGISGSGKTIWAERRKQAWEDRDGPGQAYIASADRFFYEQVGEDPKSYDFDKTRLGEAHLFCFEDFQRALEQKVYREVIVDNTNLSVAEISPYRMAARSSTHTPPAKVRIIRFDCPPSTAAKRSGHLKEGDSVLEPEKLARKQAEDLETLPPYFPDETIIRTYD